MIHISFNLFIIVLTLERPQRCRLIAAIEFHSVANPDVLVSCLAGLRDLVVERQYESIFPKIKDDKLDGGLVNKEPHADEAEQEAEESKSLFSLCN